MLIRNPEFEPLDRDQLSTGRLVPVYPLTEGITVHWLRAVIDQTVNAFAARCPISCRKRSAPGRGLMPLTEALAQIHFPDNNDLLTAAHRRLSFDEFFVLQLGVLAARQRFRGSTARPLCARRRRRWRRSWRPCPSA